MRGLGGFPHAAQVLQVTHKVRDLGTRSWRTTVIYAVTSLAHAQPAPPGSPTTSAATGRSRNGLHHIRDVTFGEDASQVRTETGPHVMMCLRNLVIGTLSRAGPVNLAAALQPTAATPIDRCHPRDQRRMKRHHATTPEPWWLFSPGRAHPTALNRRFCWPRRSSRSRLLQSRPRWAHRAPAAP